jgi:hypothetical protein
MFDSRMRAWMCGVIVAAACDEPRDAVPEGSGSSAAVGDSSSGDAPQCDGPIGAGAGACANRTICDVYDCGGKTSLYNHDGCPRTECTTDAECGDGWHCYPLVLGAACVEGELACSGDASCDCAPLDACSGNLRAHCLPESVYPVAQDCMPLLIGCADELLPWHAAMVATRDAFVAEGFAELGDELTACAPIAAAGAVDCGTPPCEVLCTIAQCAHASADACIAACDAALADSDAATIDMLVDAVARAPASACDCTACSASGSDRCEAIWSCGG